MHICVLATTLDVYKGGNHLPLFAALPEISFTILTQRVIPQSAPLPPNVQVELLPRRSGPYYYGIADWRFARNVLGTYPPEHAFWKQFDLIHLNQTLHPSLLRLEQSGRSVLYAVHHPVSADREVSLQESTLFPRLLWWMRYAPLIHCQRKTCRNAQHIMTVSATVVDRLCRDYSCDREKITVVPNGVDGELFTLGDQEPEFDACAVGSFLHPRKGFPYLLETYRGLAAAGKRIADIGKRSAEQRRQLAEIPGVTIFGTVDQMTIISLMQRSAVLLSTSLYEGFGLSLIEALACGRPAFAFDGGAVGEVLRVIDPVLVIPLRSVNILIDRALWYIHLSPEESRRRGTNYRQSVLHLYSLKKSADTLARLYTSLH
ncbi:MAG: glycosyltransferase family 4 protein [Candidatus Peregrinibacteria bacterium]